MKKYWLMFAFVFIANSVFADCFFDKSAFFLTLEKERIKELLGLTAEETSDSEVYKEAISTIKERYSIDLENDLKQLTILFSKDSNLLVFNCNFDTNKTLNLIKNMIETEKWPYHRIDEFVLCGNKYPAIRINENNNFVFYDKNTIIFCKNSAENNDSIKISDNPELVNKIKTISDNYLYIGKDAIPVFRNNSRMSDLKLEKVNNLLLYIKNKDLTLEADFDDSTTSEEAASKIKELLTPEQINKLNSQINSYLENEKNECYRYKNGLPVILFDLFESIYPQNSEYFLNSLKVSQSGNKLRITCDYEATLSIVTTLGYSSLFVQGTRKYLKKIKYYYTERTRQKISDSEVFKTLYVDNLPKYINEVKGKLKKSSLVDSVRFGIVLLIHSKAKKLIDSIENSRDADGSVAFLKNKNTESIVRFINIFFQSLSICGENEDEGYTDFSALQDKKYQKQCFKIQQAFEMYNMDHTKIMTTPDIPLLLEEHYIKESDIPDKSCEYDAVGDISHSGYISCKIHGNYQRQPKPEQPQPPKPKSTQPKSDEKKLINRFFNRSKSSEPTPPPPEFHYEFDPTNPHAPPKVIIRRPTEQKQ
jgi:hypothetical protein